MPPPQYAVYRPDVGYVQGMSFLAAILLLNMEAMDAFTALANMLTTHVFFDLYRLDVELLSKHLDVYGAWDFSVER